MTTPAKPASLDLDPAKAAYFKILAAQRLRTARSLRKRRRRKSHQ